MPCRRGTAVQTAVAAAFALVSLMGNSAGAQQVATDRRQLSTLARRPPPPRPRPRPRAPRPRPPPPIRRRSIVISGDDTRDPPPPRRSPPPPPKPSPPPPPLPPPPSPSPPPPRPSPPPPSPSPPPPSPSPPPPSPFPPPPSPSPPPPSPSPPPPRPSPPPPSPPPPPPPPPPIAVAAWSASTKASAVRLTKYAAALRCKWPRVSSWTCRDCGFAGSSLRDSWVISAQYDDASDAFIIAEDSTLNAIVVMFRSTYGNEAGWLNNLIGYGADRTIRGGVYSLHSGFSSTYYDNGIRAALIPKLKTILAAKGGTPTVIVTGHSRGGAMAVLAAVDLATDKAAEVGITNPWVQIKLYTFGQPRVGDAAYANLVESLFAERFRIVANSDPVPHAPPSALEVVDPNSLLNRLDANVQSIKSSLASWVAADLSMDKLSFDTQTIQNDNYRHHGPAILIMDYVLNGNRVYEEVVCGSSDDDSTCNNKQAAANQNSGSVGRRSVSPYNYDSTFGSSINTWPLRAFLDHSYYLEADVGNEKCMAMKPPGWWGWKVTVRTADVLFAGTDSDIYASWSCGGTTVTTSQQFLDCSLSLGEVLSGELSDVNCFERNDRDMFKFEYNEGTSSDGNAIIATSSGLEACKATSRPTLTLKSSGTGLASDWDLGGAVLEMAYTSGSTDTIITKTWGDCKPTLFGSPLTFSGRDATKSISLCESSAWWKWKLTLGTATNFGAGTDSTIKASWKCGSTAVTNGAITVSDLCGSNPCFENLGGLSNINEFTFEFDPGNWGAQGSVLPGNNPQPACTGGTKPVLTLDFTIKSTTVGVCPFCTTTTDEWTMDGSKMKLELWYIPSDVTSFWDETTGNQLSRIKYLSFSPCTSPGNVQWSSSQSKQYSLC